RMTEPGQVRFYCDAMLGRLARELRLLGLDVRYDRQKGGLVAYKEALADNRIFLTRNSRTRSLPGSFFVESQIAAEQVKQLREKFGSGAAAAAAAAAPAGAPVVAPPLKPGNRCIECNEPLQRLGRDQARPAIPFYIFQIHYEFQRCPKCGRVYWPGSHVQSIVARLAAAPPREEPGDETALAASAGARPAQRPERRPQRRFFRRGPRRSRPRQSGQA
ncbi:hypothetical protein FJY71_05500, partial [candidate division WOR-3 bacterium]|nr:hypothetical protein [candidate division WOR-3 bacterium]